MHVVDEFTIIICAALMDLEKRVSKESIYYGPVGLMAESENKSVHFADLMIGNL